MSCRWQYYAHGKVRTVVDWRADFNKYKVTCATTYGLCQWSNSAFMTTSTYQDRALESCRLAKKMSEIGYQGTNKLKAYILT